MRQSASAVIECPPRSVDPAWIDYNGHLNMAYYSLLFDNGLDHVFDRLGCGADYARSGAGSCFVVETHVSFLGELVVNDPLRITFQLLDADSKRLHYFMEMYHANDGYLAATSEQMSLHVDMATRRSAPFPPDIAARIETLKAQHATLPRPERAGRAIGIPGR